MLQPILKQIAENQTNIYVILLQVNPEDCGIPLCKVGVLTDDVYNTDSRDSGYDNFDRPSRRKHPGALEFHDASFEIIARGSSLEATLLRAMKSLGEPYECEPIVEDGLRKAIIARDRGQCIYCGKQATLADHIIPRAVGGTDEPTNLVAACWRCNRNKFDAEWRGWYRAQRCYNKVSEVTLILY